VFSISDDNQRLRGDSSLLLTAVCHNFVSPAVDTSKKRLKQGSEYDGTAGSGILFISSKILL